MSTTEKTEKVRYLHGVHFDFEGAHIALTTKGAASRSDEPYLLKSLEVCDEQEFTPLKKEVGNTRETNQNLEGNNSDMSVELQKQLDDQAALIATMTRDNGIMKAQADLGLFELDAEIEKELAAAMVDGKNGETVLKALAAVKASVLEAKVEDENPVAKALSEEAGGEGIAEEDVKVEKSILEQLEDQMNEQAKKGAK